MATWIVNRKPQSQLMLCRTQPSSNLVWATALLVAGLLGVLPCRAQVTAEFRRTLTVSPSEAVALEVDVPNAELEICYGREGQVSIVGLAKTSAGDRIDDSMLSELVRVEQNGNHVTLRQVPGPAYSVIGISMVYRIDVPYRTELSSTLETGKQNISGLLGPVKAVTNKGDITVSYISKGVQAKVGVGNLDLQVIGDLVEAEAGAGDIHCERLPRGVRAETGEGDITLMVVGPSTAVVRKGNGRIEIGGARASLNGSTDSGDLHVKAIPHEDWKLSSVTGSVRLELPPTANFELQASTNTGRLRFDRDGLAGPDSPATQFHQKVNGGGTRIEVHTESGLIALR